MPLSPSEAEEMMSKARWEAGTKSVLALFERGTQELAKIGILLADTKFELGICKGEVLLIDEALTPDSSRFWPADQYKIGGSPPSLDKQILRDYLETLDWNKEAPAPDLDPAILNKVRAGYLDICQRLTGELPEGVQA